MTLALHYDFAADKSLVARIGPELEITRSTLATYFDDAGVMQTASVNVERFDHDPVTNESLGLLVEEGRTNRGIYSEDLSNAVWVVNNVTKGNTSVTAPDGEANTKVRLTATAANGTCLQTVTSSSSSRSYAVYMKRVTGTGNIDLTTDDGATWVTKTLTSDWLRFDIQKPGITNPVFGVRIVTSGDAIDFWGSNQESGPFSTSYIKTVAATVTRNADRVLTDDVSWLNAAAGTMHFRGRSNFFFSEYTTWQLRGSGTFDNTIYVFSLANAFPTAKSKDATVQQYYMAADTVNTVNTEYRSTLAWAENDFAFASNNDPIETDSSGTVPTVTQLNVGNESGQAALNGHIAELRYYNERLLPDAVLTDMNNGIFPTSALGQDFVFHMMCPK